MSERLKQSICDEIFAFDVQPILARAAPVDIDVAVIACKFRHFNKEPIELKPGIAGELNVGFRIFDKDLTTMLFEARMVPEVGMVEPGKWINCTIRIPRSIITFGEPFKLAIDMVRENVGWFTADPLLRYHFDLEFRDRLVDADDEDELGRDGAEEEEFSKDDAEEDNFEKDEFDGDRAEEDEVEDGLSDDYSRPLSDDGHRAWSPQRTATVSALYHLLFDVSDLVQYFEDNRLPTGIQRVQIEIITSILASAPREYSTSVACFTTNTNSWVPLDAGLFSDICKLALIGGDLEERAWQRALKKLKIDIANARPLIFPDGAFLINLGTSWWLPNYFLKVRLAKAQYGVKYVPFVHDCIPIVTPEHCVDGLVQQFKAWILGAFEHADFLLANSRATAADVIRIAEYLGKKVAAPSVIPLNASFNAGRETLSTSRMPAHSSETFIKYDLEPKGYVLFVATVESRKNHLLAFSAWINLVKKYGVRRVPKLVCVGKVGWLNEPVYAKLAASGLLREKVVMLSDVADPILVQLYYNCLFTIFPSAYEGWGLPVTEALGFGKVPLVSRVASLPEAGENFAEYFRLESEAELIEKLERLIFDSEHRDAMERWIAAGYKPRSWSDIGVQLLGLIAEWADKAQNDTQPAFRPAEALLGQYYPLSDVVQFWPGVVPGETFRQGDAWWPPESWGCWTKLDTARLAFVARATSEKGGVLYLGIRGLQEGNCKVILTVKGLGSRQVSVTAKELKWVIFRAGKNELAALTSGNCAVFEIGVWSDVGVDLRKLSGGKDPRTTSIGVLGFMFCFDDDFASQLKLVTAAALNDLDSLVTMPQESESLRCAAGGAFDNTESSRPSEEDKERAEPTSPDPSNARPAIDADQEIGTEAVSGNGQNNNRKQRTSQNREGPKLPSKRRRRSSGRGFPASN